MAFKLERDVKWCGPTINGIIDYYQRWNRENPSERKRLTVNKFRYMLQTRGMQSPSGEPFTFYRMLAILQHMGIDPFNILEEPADVILRRRKRTWSKMKLPSQLQEELNFIDQEMGPHSERTEKTLNHPTQPNI